MSHDHADDIAIDWISKKLYWTDNGPVDRIRVLDIKFGYYSSLINTGQDISPKAIVVDPINRCYNIYSHKSQSNNSESESGSIIIVCT